MGPHTGKNQTGGSMSLHDITNILQRLDIMANLLSKQDFSEFSKTEIKEDIERDLAQLKLLFERLSSDQ